MAQKLELRLRGLCHQRTASKRGHPKRNHRSLPSIRSRPRCRHLNSLRRVRLTSLWRLPNRRTRRPSRRCLVSSWLLGRLATKAGGCGLWRLRHRLIRVLTLLRIYRLRSPCLLEQGRAWRLHFRHHWTLFSKGRPRRQRIKRRRVWLFWGPTLDIRLGLAAWASVTLLLHRCNNSLL